MKFRNEFVVLSENLVTLFSRNLFIIIIIVCASRFSTIYSTPFASSNQNENRLLLAFCTISHHMLPHNVATFYGKWLIQLMIIYAFNLSVFCFCFTLPSSFFFVLLSYSIRRISSRLVLALLMKECCSGSCGELLLEILKVWTNMIANRNEKNNFINHIIRSDTFPRSAW